MIFALGCFIIPKQMLFAQNTEMSCCKSSTEKKDCCKKDKKEEKPCHDSQKSNSCGDNCTSCGTCHFVAAFFYAKNTETFSFSPKIQITKEKFTYVTPEISDIFTKIWQPPKIG